MSVHQREPGRGRIYDDFAATMGDTPLVRVPRLKEKYGVGADILLKCEFFNPLGSVKDRIGVAMIEAMEEQGILNKNSTIVEPTSGNTGIALAFVAASKGYRCILTMPETMSVERVQMMKHLGAEIVLTPAAEGIGGAFAAADRLTEEIDGAVQAGQFVNPANPEVHRRTTALEIWNDTDGKVDVFVSGVGTGGTITGVSEVLKEKNPNLHSVALEPVTSPVLSGGEPGPGNMIQGIGAGFAPDVLNMDLVDEVMTIVNEDAFAMARDVAKVEGLPCGISAGAAIWAAIQIAKRAGMDDKTIVVVLPSFAERYVSTDLFSDD
ncbi:MAG: cysteine synthase A [Gemmatimonadales bacterium]|jgi:cysteine synthase|nr:cysteine synthase A [Gemmatimonadales bacterium]MDG2239817.1 cysteine synthase A [Longimicrobiales bacterium]MBT3499319.1 cysteine synthase A [Gemmatimonadales bacterium]MBT3775912.1 cysteine synthase A [Gemmatimonadales bacterium]MBT3960072.1 cysteine synthase A [Gemmatimonadales bacterium]